MSLRARRFPAFFIVAALVLPLEAATLSQQSADDFAEKISLIRGHGTSPDRPARRTRVTQDELNSWFVYRAQPVMPAGVADPHVEIVGEGRVSGRAVIDLDAVARRRPSSGSLDPLSLIGGKVPVTVTGILHTRDGMARFEVERAEMSGIPVPVTVLQEVMTYYTRTPERPTGVRLDDPFALPSNIRQIEVGQGQAVVVQ